MLLALQARSPLAEAAHGCVMQELAHAFLPRFSHVGARPHSVLVFARCFLQHYRAFPRARSHVFIYRLLLLRQALEYGASIEVAVEGWAWRS